MTTTNTVPAMLQPAHDELARLRKPYVPEKDDSVWEATTMFESRGWKRLGNMILFVIFSPIMWLIEWFTDGGGGDVNKGWQDIVIPMGLGFVVTPIALYVATDISGPDCYVIGALTAGGLFLLAGLCWIITGYSYSLWIYYHVLSRPLAARMRKQDEADYQQALEQHNKDMTEYTGNHSLALQKANVALSGYNATGPDTQYRVTDTGFVKVVSADSYMRDAKKLFGKAVSLKDKLVKR